jgi:glyoxylase-like metal-dependent hydrolase (beta-lactamase superfamily II)
MKEKADSMNISEKELHYPLGATLPEPGQCIEVAPGCKWIRMSLPFALNHINLWLLRDQIDTEHGTVQGWTVVDTCIHREESKAQWEAIFASALEGLPIVRVLVTHMHPDHVGLAHWLCERWQAPLWMSATDFLAARAISAGAAADVGGMSAATFFAQHGLNSPEQVAQVAARAQYYPSMVPSLPTQYRRIRDGSIVPIGPHHWRCISGYGHAPEHIALYCEALGVLISGDMVLPRISTNVSVYAQEPEANALDAFLDSINKFMPLPANTLVLPSHGKPFSGLHARIAQLHAHHEARLHDVLQACSQQPCSAADMLPVLFSRALDLHQTTFAMGESIAHLNYLWHQGQLRRHLDANGVYRFSLARMDADGHHITHP